MSQQRSQDCPVEEGESLENVEMHQQPEENQTSSSGEPSSSLRQDKVGQQQQQQQQVPPAGEIQPPKKPTPKQTPSRYIPPRGLPGIRRLSVKNKAQRVPPVVAEVLNDQFLSQSFAKGGGVGESLGQPVYHNARQMFSHYLSTAITGAKKAAKKRKSKEISGMDMVCGVEKAVKKWKRDHDDDDTQGPSRKSVAI